MTINYNEMRYLVLYDLDIFKITNKKLNQSINAIHNLEYSRSFLIFTQNLKIMKGIIKTNRGEMHVNFYDNDAPKTVENFVKLAKDGYYNGIKWHRVLPDFVIQGGCPKGTGTGGPGYSIDCELDGGNQHHERGVLSMAHAGRNTGGSQFFVCHSRNNTAHLDGNHTCFGKVSEGLDVIDQIKVGDTIDEIVILED